jgi:hypothetical protein
MNNAFVEHSDKTENSWKETLISQFSCEKLVVPATSIAEPVDFCAAPAEAPTIFLIGTGTFLQEKNKKSCFR